MLMYRTTSRQVMIDEAHKQLAEFKRLNDKGFWKDQGYTDKEIQNKIDLFEKDILLTEGKISFAEYIKAYHKVHGKVVEI